MSNKKQYAKPQLTELGTIEEMTHAFRATSVADSYIYGDQTIESNGSKTGVVISN